MKVGDLVVDDYRDDMGIVMSKPRLSTGRDNAVLGVMSGDIWEVVDVLCPDGEVRVLTTNELKVIHESR